MENLAFCHDMLWVVLANAKTFKIVFIKDVNECSNIRMSFEYSNRISEFEYSHF